MKLLIFAHVPPPHHGQSYMVQLMLNGLGGDHRKSHLRQKQTPNAAASPAPNRTVECYHVNARMSRQLEDIGDMRIGKLFSLLGYCLEAIWCHFRHGVDNFYYIPAPGKRSALYRDWMVLMICRPFFKRIILHWHAAGLAKWLETAVQIRARALTFHALKYANLSIVLSNYNRRDADKLLPRTVRLVPNGIPDPCPDYVREALPRRRARFAVRQKLLARQTPGLPELKDAGADPEVFKVVFLGHCMRQKGLFDTLDAVVLANEQLVKSDLPMRMHVAVAGEFVDAREREEFEQRLRSEQQSGGVSYLGFVAGEAKKRLLMESDCLCFPTYYYAESFGLVLVEAMAFGLPIVATHWRSIPELVPLNYSGIVDPRATGAIAAALRRVMEVESGESFRDLFLKRFTVEQHLAALKEALLSVDDTPLTSPPIPFTTPAYS